MGRHLLIVFLASFVACCTCLPRVAIIGGGVGGAFSAYLVSNATEGDVDIDIFEAKAVGGRAQDMEFGGERMEVGASMIYGKNYYMKEAARAMGLTEKPYTDGGPLHIYDGHKIVFSPGPSAIQQTWAVLSRYGLAPVVWGAYVKRMFHKLAPIYSLQDQGVTFDRMDDMLKQLGLYDMTQQHCNETAKSVLASSWWGRWSGGRVFLEELVAAINRCNYNQRNGELNALAGAVSYLPAADPDVWAVKEGHSALAARLIEASGAKLQLHVNISAIVREGDKYLLHVRGEADETADTLGPYDAVIIAAPLEKARIILPEDIEPLPPPREFQTTISTFVRGEIQGSYFEQGQHKCSWDPDSKGGVMGVIAQAAVWVQKCLDSLLKVLGKGDAKGIPINAQIFVTEGADTVFSALTMKKLMAPGDAIYKVFSSTELSNDTLAALFGPKFQLLEVKHWKAYPHFNPPERFAPFKLAPGLFYSNTIARTLRRQWRCLPLQPGPVHCWQHSTWLLEAEALKGGAVVWKGGWRQQPLLRDGAIVSGNGTLLAAAQPLWQEMVNCWQQHCHYGRKWCTVGSTTVT